MKVPRIRVDKQDSDLDLYAVRHCITWHVRVRVKYLLPEERAARTIAARKLGRKLRKREYVSFSNSRPTDLRRSNLVIKLRKKSPPAPRIRVNKQDRDLRMSVSSRGDVYLTNRTTNRCVARVIAERKLGRSLKKTERVFFRNKSAHDVRRSNLVISSVEHWQRISRPAKKKTSKYKGVCWYKRGKKWRASILLPNGKWKHLGYFEDEHDAAIAYNQAVEEFDFPHAFLNDV